MGGGWGYNKVTFYSRPGVVFFPWPDMTWLPSFCLPIGSSCLNFSSDAEVNISIFLFGQIGNIVP